MLRFLPALLLLALSALAPARAQQWIEHRPEGASYRVEFPGPPTLETDDQQGRGGPIKLVMAEYIASGGVSFSSMHIVYPLNSLNPDPQIELDRVRAGGLKEANGQLREEKRISLGGAPARRIVLDLPQPERTGVWLYVLSGNRLFQAIAVVPRGQEGSADVQRFLDSFALVSP